jgi:hypothetical protein
MSCYAGNGWRHAWLAVLLAGQITLAADAGAEDLRGFTRHAAQRLQLADEVPLRWRGADDALCRAIESIEFMLGSDGARFREIPTQTTLQANLALAALPGTIDSAAPVVLVLYDENDAPLDALPIPLAGVHSL